jgi:hypothetical protein
MVVTALMKSRDPTRGRSTSARPPTALPKLSMRPRQKKQKAICFVTGVPGAGKTLAGLNLVTQRTNVHEEEHAVFLSGNWPLVEVLREALARDEVDRSRNSDNKIRKGDAERKVKGFVQNIMHFRDANLGISGSLIHQSRRSRSLTRRSALGIGARYQVYGAKER